MTGSTPAPELGEQESRTGTGEAEQFWDAHYREHERAFSGNVNPLVLDVAGQLSAGRALDLGCGEGADAIWLAQQGWRVTAVDVSATALDRTAHHAADAGVADRIDIAQHDLTLSLPDGTFDLVNAQYLQSPVNLPRPQILRAAAGLVTVGGHLLIVDHASAPPWSWADPSAGFPTPQQTLTTLQLPRTGWQPVRVDAASRTATGPGGQIATVTDNILLLRRLTDQT